MDPRTQALLHVTLDLDSSVSEPEFNAWYFDEHVADRLLCPGFVGASRFRVRDSDQTADAGGSKARAPVYLAIYELANPEVLQTPEYLRLRSDPSDRTRKMLGAMRGVSRTVYTRIHPSETSADAAIV
jgi:hypothetical protein